MSKTNKIAEFISKNRKGIIAGSIAQLVLGTILVEVYHAIHNTIVKE